MKHIIPILILTAGLLPKAGLCQLNNGGLYANFGVDADTRTNWMKYGLVTGAVASDDWFAPAGLGYNVIDTSNAPTYLALLQAGNNISFNKQMSALLYAKVGGKLWLDAVYGRDYSASSALKDSTTFTVAAKNGDNPTNWLGGVSNFPNKNDLIDVYAHMRRDGTTVHDSMWLFTGVSTFGTRGSSYFDVEMYRNSFTYSPATGKFTTAGTSAGHTQWLFDASGNIIQTGDVIIAVNFSPGMVPVVDIRIWISQTTLSTVTPARFSFTGAFNGASASPTYGYASIVSKTGSTAFGAGISNYSLNATLDTTYSTPWGTGGPSGGANWSAQYMSQQFIEVGLNLTRIGVDPALYSALSPCQPLFSDIFFKSRSSNSFTSNMQDFVTPLTFTRTPVMDYSLKGDTIRCNHQPATITLTNNSTVGVYTWQTAAGISGSNNDSSQLTITKPGTYIVSASPASGCPPTRVDTIVVPIDTFPPVASSSVGLTGSYQLQLYGGNSVASNYPTPFGGSQGLTYTWSGPSGFSSTLQNPLTDTVWGTYLLTSTEKRNGCTDTASVKVTWAMFTALLAHDLTLSAVGGNGGVSLHWTDASTGSVSGYVVERMNTSSVFEPIGSVDGGGCRCFVDAQPKSGVNEYRVEAMSASGSAYYSAVVSITQNSGSGNNVYIAGNNLIADMDNDQQAVLVVYDVTGQTLLRQNVWLSKGNNTVTLPVHSGAAPAVRVVGLIAEGKVVFAGKGLW